MNDLNTSTPSLARTVSSGTLWGSSTSIVLKGFTILYLIIVLKQLSLYQYGVAELVMSVAGLMAIFHLPGLHSVVIADMSRERGQGNEKRSREILHDYVRLRYVGALIPWALLFFGAEFVSHYYNEEISTMIRILSFTFLSGPIKTALQIIFRVHLKFKETAFLSFMDEGYKLLIAAIAVLYLGLGPLGVIVAYVFSDLLSTLTALVLWKEHLRDIFPPLNRLSEDKNEHFYSILLTHGKWGIMTNSLGSLGNTIRVWVVKIFLGTEAVALYSVAQGLFLQTSTLFPLGQVIAPIVYENFNNHEKLSHMVSKGIKYQVLGHAIVVSGVIFAVPVLIWNVFPQYGDSLMVFFAMLPALFPMAFSGMFSMLFVAKQRQRNLFEVTVLRTLSIAILTPLFIWWFGVIGVSFEILATAIIFALERYRKSKLLLPGFRLTLRELVLFDDYDRQVLSRVKVTIVKTLQGVGILKKV